MKILLVTCCTLFALVLAAPQLRAEMIDNPEYVSWKSHKPGTSVTHEMKNAMQGMTMTQTIVHTLKEVTPEKAVVEMSMQMDMGGMKHENKQTRTVAAQVEKTQANMPEGMKGEYKETGEESIDVNGKSYKCKTFEFTGEGNNMKSSGKVWSCTEIPGATAQMKMTMEGQVKGESSLRVVSIDVK